jgi:hypothetical protein
MIILLTVNQLGKLRDDLDANLTYEGDNNIILLQSSNYLFDVFEKKKAGMATNMLTRSGVNSRRSIVKIKYTTPCTIGLSQLQSTMLCAAAISQVYIVVSLYLTPPA